MARLTPTSIFSLTRRRQPPCPRVVLGKHAATSPARRRNGKTPPLRFLRASQTRVLHSHRRWPTHATSLAQQHAVSCHDTHRTECPCRCRRVVCRSRYACLLAASRGVGTLSPRVSQRRLSIVASFVASFVASCVDCRRVACRADSLLPIRPFAGRTPGPHRLQRRGGPT